MSAINGCVVVKIAMDGIMTQYQNLFALHSFRNCSSFSFLSTQQAVHYHSMKLAVFVWRLVQQMSSETTPLDSANSVSIYSVIALQFSTPAILLFFHPNDHHF